MQLTGLTKDLFDHESHGKSREVRNSYLRDALDPKTTYEMAGLFDNDSPRPPGRVFWHRDLRGSGVLAWYLDPAEVKRAYPKDGEEIEREFGSDPIVALNPDVLKINNREYVTSIIDHEKTHGSQPGKQTLKRLGVMTRYGPLHLGEMLIEGGVEWAMEKRGKKAPSKFMQEYGGKKTSYGIYKDFVYDLEARKHGIMRQIYRAAKRGGMNSVIRLLETVPEIDTLVNVYASALNQKKPRYLN